MFRVVTENPDTFAIETRGEHQTLKLARKAIRDEIEAGSENSFWIINTETEEIL